ncbi:MAG: hypothetical protein ACFFAZ_04450 [Promethearchaeota archaeon]
MVDRLDYRIVGLVILFLLCWMGYCPTAGRSALVWSDDFDDGNYDGWTIVENTALYDWATEDGYFGFRGSNWSAANNYLELNDTIEPAIWGAISHPSDVAYGTWSFDMKLNVTQLNGPIALFLFISNDMHDLDDENERITACVHFRTIEGADDAVGLSLRKVITGVGTTIADYETRIPAAAWHHIDVTRDGSGLFTVYLNGSLVMQGIDTDIGTSEILWLWFKKGQMVDNVVVSDTVDIAPPINWLTISVIGAGAVVIIAVLVIILRRR